MKVIDQGYIYNAEQADRLHQVCYFTTLYQLNSGAILATFRYGSGKDSDDGNCMVARSIDQGLTWHTISAGFSRLSDGVDGEIREADLLEVDQGNLMAFITWIDRSQGPKLYDSQTDSVLPSRLLLAQSNDAGQTWTPGRRLSTQSLSGPVMTGPSVTIPGRGRLIFFENFQHEKADGPSIHSAHALFSPDGQSFDRVVKVARHHDDRLFYWDQRHAICPKTNRLIGLFWTYDRPAEQDVDIHLAWGAADTLSWQPPVSTGIKGQIAAPIPMPDGRLLAFYVHRHDPGSMRLIASPDQGRTWDHDHQLIVYHHTAPTPDRAAGPSNFAQCWDEMSRWCFGHPAGIVLDRQTVLLTYYGGPCPTRLSARWARVSV